VNAPTETSDHSRSNEGDLKLDPCSTAISDVSEPLNLPPHTLVLKTEQLLKNFDSLLVSTLFGCASLLPGPAGIAAATGAVGFDLSKRYWVGALLSGLSMIPLAGYLPGAAKVVWCVSLINKQLDAIEELLPELRPWPELIDRVKSSVGKFTSKLTEFKLTAPLCVRLKNILDYPTTLDDITPATEL
jgi:hypothetical protein